MAVPKTRADVVDSEGGCREGRQAARDMTEHPNAVPIEMQQPARRDGGHDGEERSGYPAGNASRHHDDGDDRRSNGKRGHRRVAQVGERGAQLGQGLGRRHVDPEQLRELADRDGDPDSRQESDEHGARQEIRQKAQPHQPRDQQAAPRPSARLTPPVADTDGCRGQRLRPHLPRGSRPSPNRRRPQGGGTSRGSANTAIGSNIV